MTMTTVRTNPTARPTGAMKSVDYLGKMEVKAPKEEREECVNGAASSEHLDLLSGLSKSPKEIPCSYLYDETGSSLYNQITELEEYYPFKTELAMLHKHSAEIISHIPPGAVLVELGCGSAEKTAALQEALLSRDGPEACTFVGIDVSADFLEQAKGNLLAACSKMRPENVEMIQATYLNGVREARKRHPDEVLCILWLGSSIGNLAPPETLDFFKDLLRISGPKTEVLICADLWKDKATLHAAYCDSKGVTKAFILNGMKHAIKSASNGQITIDVSKWQYDVVVNDELHQVEMHVVAGENIKLNKDIEIKIGDRILMEISRKFQVEQMRGLAYQSGFYYQAHWSNALYSIQTFCSPQIACHLAWRDTDSLFSRLRDWNACPIELRHPFLFYYGHVSSFAKTRMLKKEEPSQWDIMFSRGIDPDVSDPSQCHDHPEAPQQWPSKEEVIKYVMQQRQTMLKSLASGEVSALTLHLSLEHERLHQETLCYMLAQQQKQQWEAAHLRADGSLLENGAAFTETLARWEEDMRPGGGAAACEGKPSWVNIPPGTVQLGVDTDSSCGFVWDNEGPPKDEEPVEAFCVASHPVSIGSFREFVVSAKGYSRPVFWLPAHLEVIGSQQSCPSNWTLTEEGDVWVHYPEGSWHWTQVQHRPVWCSLAEASAYCVFKRARIMTEAEYQRILDLNVPQARVFMLQSGAWEHTSSIHAPFPRFQPMDGYEEYSADFFDDKHFVLKGASPYTHPSAVRPSFRNFYQDVYPYVFAKFRCCRTP